MLSTCFCFKYIYFFLFVIFFHHFDVRFYLILFTIKIKLSSKFVVGYFFFLHFVIALDHFYYLHSHVHFFFSCSVVWILGGCHLDLSICFYMFCECVFLDFFFEMLYFIPYGPTDIVSTHEKMFCFMNSSHFPSKSNQTEPNRTNEQYSIFSRVRADEVFLIGIYTVPFFFK